MSEIDITDPERPITEVYVGDVLDYSFNWDDGFLDGDTISAHLVTGEAGLAVSDEQEVAGVVTAFFTISGTVGQTLRADCEITTTPGGRTKTRSLYFKIIGVADAVSLAPEDGTGLANADSYCTVAFADAYHAGRQNSAWVGATDDKEAALRKATDYMLQRYRAGWQGVRTLYTQALDWPRGGVVVDGYSVPANVVPATVAYACAELALRALADDLNPDLDRGGQIESERVGDIEVTYASGAPGAVTFPAIDAMLAPYLVGGAGAGGVNRKVLRA